MKINKIVKPKSVTLTTEQLNQYFCCCIPGREGKPHLDFCTSLEVDNIIDGHVSSSYA